MLRKETREFLEYWPQRESIDSKVLAICKKYEKRNPSQIYNRTVKYANSMFDDLYYIFQYLPEEYLKKVNLENGLRYLNFEENQKAKFSNARLRAALTQATTGLSALKEILVQNKTLDSLYRTKLAEMEYVAKLLYEISTGQMSITKSPETRSRRTRTRNQFSRKISI